MKDVSPCLTALVDLLHAHRGIKPDIKQFTDLKKLEGEVGEYRERAADGLLGFEVQLLSGIVVAVLEDPATTLSGLVTKTNEINIQFRINEEWVRVVRTAAYFRDRVFKKNKDDKDFTLESGWEWLPSDWKAASDQNMAVRE